jgi:hypothetical protein
VGLPSDLNKRRPLPLGVLAETAFYSRESVLHLRDTVISTSIVSLPHPCRSAFGYLRPVEQRWLDASGYEAREDGAAFVIF